MIAVFIMHMAVIAMVVAVIMVAAAAISMMVVTTMVVMAMAAQTEQAIILAGCAQRHGAGPHQAAFQETEFFAFGHLLIPPG